MWRLPGPIRGYAMTDETHEPAIPARDVAAVADVHAVVATVPPDLPEDEEVDADLGYLSYRRLVWRRFSRNRLALIGGTILILFYFVAIFAEFIAPYAVGHDNIRLRYVPPQTVHLSFTGPYVYGLAQTRDPITLEQVYRTDTTRRYPVRLFA